MVHLKSAVTEPLHTDEDAPSRAGILQHHMLLVFGWRAEAWLSLEMLVFNSAVNWELATSCKGKEVALCIFLSPQVGRTYSSCFLSLLTRGLTWLLHFYWNSCCLIKKDILSTDLYRQEREEQVRITFQIKCFRQHWAKSPAILCYAVLSFVAPNLQKVSSWQCLLESNQPGSVVLSELLGIQKTLFCLLKGMALG